MSNKLTFNEVKEKNLLLLQQYIPVVSRVHGDSHPEFHDVHKVFDELIEKINKSEDKKEGLKDQFDKLGKITDNYTVPSDVCETYEAVYKMLAELDRAYKG